MPSPDSPIWAISSFYNPAGYQRRRQNFHRFREALGIPLVMVELSYNGRYEIGPDASDIVVHLPGKDVFWQKERLLNVAMRYLPPEVTYVAWLDCDILFQNPHWAANAVQRLQEVSLVQLFSHLYDLRPDGSLPDAPDYPATPSGTGIAYLVDTSAVREGDFQPRSTAHMRQGAFGLAWAAQRSLIDAHGFYDAMILGSGDRAMACAAYGRFGDAISSIHLNLRRAEHYLAWARPYHAAITGPVSYLQGAIHHLWHGDLADRGYKERHVAFAEHDFDPERDLQLDANGVWRWAEVRPEMDALIRSYFHSRCEDGTHT